eukprot:24245_1
MFSNSILMSTTLVKTFVILITLRPYSAIGQIEQCFTSNDISYIDAWYSADSFNISDNSWNDKSGNGNHAMFTFGSTKTIRYFDGKDQLHDLWTFGDNPVLYGNATTTFPLFINPENWSVFNLCRYYGKSRQRILSSSNTDNVILGFHGGKSGFASGPCNVGCDVSINNNEDKFGDAWVFSSQQYDYYRGNFVDLTKPNNGGTPLTTTTIQFGINVWTTQELSDYACAEVLILNKKLTLAEILCIENHFQQKYYSQSPTQHPTNIPTITPTKPPTQHPTHDPTKSPTKSPTKHPTKSPTKHPTNFPTATPITSPTQHPTNIPKSPTKHPTNFPTATPITSPTQHPTNIPTTTPTKSPTVAPSTQTKYPTYNPTHPTIYPTVTPSAHTKYPTYNPTIYPTKANDVEIVDVYTTILNNEENIIYVNANNTFTIVLIFSCVVLGLCGIIIGLIIWIKKSKGNVQIKSYSDTDNIGIEIERVTSVSNMGSGGTPMVGTVIHDVSVSPLPPKIPPAVVTDYGNANTKDMNEGNEGHIAYMDVENDVVNAINKTNVGNQYETPFQAGNNDDEIVNQINKTNIGNDNDTPFDIIDDNDLTAGTTNENTDNDTQIWFEYVNKYGKQPQNAFQLVAFSRTGLQYESLSFKEATMIYNQMK